MQRNDKWEVGDMTDLVSDFRILGFAYVKSSRKVKDKKCNH